MFLAWGFLVGIFAVWLYAAIRPRYGAGPKTALCAGAAVWGIGYLGASRSTKASTICWDVQAAVGCSVTLKCEPRRREFFAHQFAPSSSHLLQ